MTNKILLTGAGFSRNFGLPLASDVWGLIFNNLEIQSTKKIRSDLLKEYNYEKFKEERDCFLERIDVIFNDIFEKLTIKVFEMNFGISHKDIRNFIQMIVGKKFDEGYLFTTNQDLLLERLFIEPGSDKGKITSPYIGNCLWNFEAKEHEKMPCPLKNSI